MDVDNGNFGSFKVKEEEKIRSKGDASYYNRKTNTWRCPYYTTKPKPKCDRFVHLLTHAEDVAIHDEDYKIKGQHGALAKVLTPLPK
ncbi:lrr receptor-like serine threonine-protein kinase [Hordeum vulgare]|nr:lrr receptor-like serine threonine-protein kinase [Hordeum vulgare]